MLLGLSIISVNQFQSPPQGSGCYFMPCLFLHYTSTKYEQDSLGFSAHQHHILRERNLITEPECKPVETLGQWFAL